MDLATILGLVIAFGSILLGQALEGGHIGSIAQPTAAIIVVGGTIGAVAVQFPAATLKQTLREIGRIFRPDASTNEDIVATLVLLANKARREGLVALEKDAAAVTDDFLRRSLELAVDGTEAKGLRAAMELEIGHFEEEGEAPAKVLEAGGGYAPTVGILGAVLGLIHVMENLSDPSKLGSGIAVAFVATIYGVGMANLLFLPMAGKLKMRHREQTVRMELILEGVCSIAEGENPRLIERKLSVYAHARDQGVSADAARTAAKAA